MNRRDLETVLRLASYELDAMQAEDEEGTLACQESFDAVKAFWGNPRSSWMVPAAHGVDTLKVFPEGYDRN